MEKLESLLKELGYELIDVIDDINDEWMECLVHIKDGQYCSFKERRIKLYGRTYVVDSTYDEDIAEYFTISDTNSRKEVSMLKGIITLMNSDVRVIITEGDYVTPTVVFVGTVYEVPSVLYHRVIDSNGVKIHNNILRIHLIKG